MHMVHCSENPQTHPYKDFHCRVPKFKRIFEIRIRYLLIVSNIPIHFQKAIFSDILFEKIQKLFIPSFFVPDSGVYWI